jgi:membrane-associated phospholipid phosphatase
MTVAARYSLFFLLMPLATVAPAQAADPDRPMFTSTDIVFVVSVGMMTLAITPVDRELATWTQDSLLQRNLMARRTAAFVREVATPGSIIIGSALYLYGSAVDNERMEELGLHGLEALAAGGALTFLLKGMIGRARPYMNPESPWNIGFLRGFGSQDYRSFPSGHTVMAFAAAAAVSETTDKWWPRATWAVAPLLYVGAAAAGLSRMYDNKHWASDTVIGAGIGTFAGLKIIRYHETEPDNWIDRVFLSVSIPLDERGAGAPSFSVIPRSALPPITPP